jgi:exopolyphosphatase / guanosine-5'-triphosphate,3'-diphosphate pyrophosphatase
MSKRVASIDIGTNTALLSLAELAPDGPKVFLERATITRLGQGVDASRVLHPEAVLRTTDCLRSYADLIRTHRIDAASVVATSAMRDAGASGEPIRALVREEMGADLEIISGAREAELTFLGALSGLALPEGALCVFDIGGGSTEVIFGQSKAGVVTRAAGQSLDVGSVRLTERHVLHDPPTAAEREALEQAVRATFAPIEERRNAGRSEALHVVGVAGTVTTAAAVIHQIAPYDGARVHGATVSMAQVQTMLDELAAMPLSARSKVPGLDPKRADVIVAGAAIMCGVMSALGASSVQVSDRGVRWGLLQELWRNRAR